MTDAGALRPRRRRDVEAVDVDGELVLWDPRRREVHRLDPLGSLFWSFLDGETTLAELAADAVEVWGITTAQATSGLETLVDQLDGAGLLDSGDVPETVSPSRYLVDPPSP